MSWRSVALLWFVTCYGSLAESFSLETHKHSAKPTTASSTFWEHVEEGPADIILGIAAAFRACVRDYFLFSRSVSQRQLLQHRPTSPLLTHCHSFIVAPLHYYYYGTAPSTHHNTVCSSFMFWRRTILER